MTVLNGSQSSKREETNVKRVLRETKTRLSSKSKKSNNEVYIILKNKLIYLCMQSKGDMELDEQFDEKDHQIIEEDIEQLQRDIQDIQFDKHTTTQTVNIV